MKALTAAVLLAVALALAAPARSAIDDAGCVQSLALVVMDGDCSNYDDTYKYFCPRRECKDRLELVAQVCLAEGYRLADQVVTAAKAIEAARGGPYPDDPSWANATNDNVTGLILACTNVAAPA